MNTEKAPELKPCPFCGGCKIGFAISKGSRGYPDQYDVCCDDCGASTDLFHEKIQAVEKWNTRAASTAAEAKCVKCGHNRFAGTCMEQVKFTDPTGKGVYVCGCHCEFPTTTATAAREAAEEIVHLLKPGRSQREKNVYVDTIVDMLSKHCFPVSGDVISRAEALRTVCFMCADPERYTAPEFIEAQDDWCHRHIKPNEPFDGRVAAECRATKLRQLPAVQPIAAGGWLPIESAPKDGTKILVFTHGGDVEISQWFETKMDEFDPVEGADNLYRKIEKTYYEGWNSNGFTHWMPLPAPPAVLEAIEVKGENEPCIPTNPVNLKN